MEEFKKLFLDNINKYPKRIREALLSFDNAIFVKETIQKNNLQESYKDILLEEISYALIGVISLDDFVKRIEEKLNLEPTKAGNIFREINKKIFFNLKEDILLASQISQEIGLMAAFESKEGDKKTVSKETLENKPEKEQSQKTVKVLNLKDKEENNKAMGKINVQSDSKNKIDLSIQKEVIRKEIKPSEKNEPSANKLNLSEKENIISPPRNNNSSQSKELKPTMPRIISFQQKQIPISKSEKPEESFAEKVSSISQKKPSLFGKIEFANQNQQEPETTKKVVSDGPTFKTVEYQSKDSPEGNKLKNKFKNVIKLKE